jgi:AcrR family transcriptional regulator
VARPSRLTREAIVEVARDVIAADGVRALSLRPLAARFGVTAPALYAHFDSKESLLAAVAEEEFASLIAHLEGAVTGLADPVARIKAQCRAYVDYALSHPAFFEIIFVFRPAWAPQPAAEELPIASKSFEISAVAVEDAIAQGALRETDALKASLTIWAAIHGVASILLARPDLGADYESELITSVIDSVVAGLSTEKGR